MDFLDELLVKDFWALEVREKGFDLAMGYFIGRGRPVLEALKLALKCYPGVGEVE